MRVTDYIHALKLPFTLQLPSGDELQRFVYSYLIFAERIGIIDCGVAASSSRILEQVRRAGRDPQDITLAVITHAHPDHIGGARGLKRETGCTIAAHVAAIPWIEDVARQYEERPIPSFHEIVEGSVEVDRGLNDDDALDLGPQTILRVIHTPGHSTGHISLYLPGHGALFCGDALPQPGQPPIYDDPVAALASIRELGAIDGIDLLFSSWDEPCTGHKAARARINAAAEYIHRMHRIVTRVAEAHGTRDARAVTGGVFEHLGLPEAMANPLTIRSIQGHLQADPGDLPADSAS